MVPDGWLPSGSVGYTRGDTTFKIETEVENDSQQITDEIWHMAAFNVTGPGGFSPFSGGSICNNVTLGPGESVSCDTNAVIESNFVLGTYTYAVTIDPDNAVAETNENNNVYTGTFEVCDT